MFYFWIVELLKWWGVEMLKDWIVEFLKDRIVSCWIVELLNYWIVTVSSTSRQKFKSELENPFIQMKAYIFCLTVHIKQEFWHQKFCSSCKYLLEGFQPKTCEKLSSKNLPELSIQYNSASPTIIIKKSKQAGAELGQAQPQIWRGWGPDILN